MTLPPGRRPIEVTGIDKKTSPELWKAAGELNAWIDYLSHPESNSGPRLYRPVHPGDQSPTGSKYVDLSVPSGPTDMDNDPSYTVMSVLDGYAADPAELFKAAQAVSGVDEGVVTKGYSNFLQGCFTYPEDQIPELSGKSPSGGTGASAPAPTAPPRGQNCYPELSQIRGDWANIRNGWVSTENNDAQAYEDDFIRFQVYLESSFLKLGEYLVKYVEIHRKAGKDIATLMDHLTQQFAQYQPRSEGFTLDLKSFLITGIVELVCAVLTDGVSLAFQAKSLGAAGAQMVGDGAKTLHPTDTPLQSAYFITEVVKQYLDAVNKIEQDVSAALARLKADLNNTMGELRNDRAYVSKITQKSSDQAPQFHDYSQGWRV